MATLSFYARTVGNIASGTKPVLDNINKSPAIEITFTSDPDGDLKLSTNGGLPDPNTWVIIDGVTMTFTLDFSGNLPNTSTFQDVGGQDLRDKQIAIITASDGTQYYFVTDGSATLAAMNALPNGAQAVTNVSTSNPVLVCFLRGTLIDTPEGQCPIEKLKPGDAVCTADGRALPLRWVGSRIVTVAEMLLHPELRPIVFPRDMFGTDLPMRRLKLSASHRIAMGGWQTDLLFGLETVLLRANHLCGSGAQRVLPNRPIEYFHLMFDEHVLVLANGLACESFQLGERSELALDPETLADLVASVPGQTLQSLMTRQDCLPTLKSPQAHALLNWSSPPEPEAPRPEPVTAEVITLRIAA